MPMVLLLQGWSFAIVRRTTTKTKMGTGWWEGMAIGITIEKLFLLILQCLGSVSVTNNLNIYQRLYD